MRPFSCTVAVLLLAACQGPADGELEPFTSLALPTPLPEAPAELPSPTDLVTETLSFMADQESFAFQALVQYDAIQEDGSSIQFDLGQRMLVDRSGRAAWVTVRDDATVDSVWFSDGMLSMRRQPGDLYGFLELPVSLGDLASTLSEDYDIPVPFGDFLGGDAGSIFLDDLEGSLYVGESWVAPNWTHQVLLRKAEVDIQLWIAMGDEPLLNRLKITWKNEPGSPSYVANFKDWRLNPTLPADAFKFTIPTEGERVEIVPNLDAGSQGGDR